jgi:hypothetical protein
VPLQWRGFIFCAFWTLKKNEKKTCVGGDDVYFREHEVMRARQRKPHKQLPLNKPN